MPTYTGSDPQKKITIDSDQPIVANHVMLASLVQALDVLQAVAPIDNLLWERIFQDADKTTFNYRVILKDKRTWNQALVFATGQPEPMMTTSVQDWWKVSEVGLQKLVRDVLVAYSMSLVLTRVKVNYV